jgi:host factor-I protein
VSQMVYKHAISTVVPARNVSSPLDYGSTNGGTTTTTNSNGTNGHSNGSNGQPAKE